MRTFGRIVAGVIVAPVAALALLGAGINQPVIFALVVVLGCVLSALVAVLILPSKVRRSGGIVSLGIVSLVVATHYVRQYRRDDADGFLLTAIVVAIFAMVGVPVLAARSRRSIDKDRGGEGSVEKARMADDV